MKLTEEEFKKKYGFDYPIDARERDMIIMSNLSNLQENLSYKNVELGLIQKI